MNIDEFLDNQKPVEAAPAVSSASDDLKSKIAKIQELLAARKFEEANSSFTQLREDYAKLVKQQDSERQEFQASMKQISDELMQRLDKMSADIDKRTEIVTRLLSKATSQLAMDDFIGANKSYATMRDVLSGMPEGFAEKKSQLEAEILQFYIKFKEKYTHSQKAKFDQLIRQVALMVDQVEFLIFENRRAEAQVALDKAKEAFERLPAGFLYEKAGLHQRIIDVTASLNNPAIASKRQFAPEPLQDLKNDVLRNDVLSDPFQGSKSWLPEPEVPKPDHKFPDIESPKKKGIFGLFRR